MASNRALPAVRTASLIGSGFETPEVSRSNTFSVGLAIEYDGATADGFAWCGISKFSELLEPPGGNASGTCGSSIAGCAGGCTTTPDAGVGCNNGGSPAITGTTTRGRVS